MFWAGLLGINVSLNQSFGLSLGAEYPESIISIAMLIYCYAMTH